MIAGGASLAPRRCSLPLVAMPARSRPACLCTPLSTAARNSRKRRFWCGVLPGLSRLVPSSALSAVMAIDQLQCLPEPLMPANGFSCTMRLQAVAQRDLAQHGHHQLVVVDGDVGVLEDRRHLELHGATSLWRVMIGTPSL